MMSRCILQGSSSASRDVDLEPNLQWHDGAESFHLRLDLPGFRKEEFRVLVDASGRVTVRGRRPAGHARVHRVFQLPPTADLHRIAARFDGAALHLTVPKLPPGAADHVVRAKAMAEWATAEANEPEKVKERGKWDNGQVFAAAVAAFALGGIITHRLLSITNT